MFAEEKRAAIVANPLAIARVAQQGNFLKYHRRLD